MDGDSVTSVCLDTPQGSVENKESVEVKEDVHDLEPDAPNEKNLDEEDEAILSNENEHKERLVELLEATDQDQGTVVEGDIAPEAADFTQNQDEAEESNGLLTEEPIVSCKYLLIQPHSHYVMVSLLNKS